MYEVGRAGGFVSRQMWRRRGEGTLYGAAAVALALVAVGALVGVAYTGVAPLRALAAVVAAAAAGGCWYTWTRSRRVLRQAGKAAIGARSERDVRAVIRRTGSIAAAYGIMLGARGGDCDAVVFTAGRGAAAVEVKTGHGEVAVDGDTMRVGRRVLPKNPTGQAAFQARRLSDALGRKPVLAVVCVPGMTNRPFATAKGVWVCSADDLKTVLDRAPRIFDSPAEAQETMKRLWHKNNS
ncbi:NERD domain-containing protein [Actinoallomurus sp. NPDC050550]|uniref:NERD domain-containing protein n=1 Tax=Actinoallomurus sp. NPDC050550 TaxID=3154937 RepID=UPI0033F5F78F